MTTVREQIMRAVVVALNSDARPVGVPLTQRSRISQIGEEQMPAITVYPVKEETERLGQLTRRSFVFRAECAVDAAPGDDTPVDALLDDMIAWCTTALAGSKLGGLAQDTQELGCEWQIEARDYAFAAASIDFGVRYVTPVQSQHAQ